MKTGNFLRARRRAQLSEEERAALEGAVSIVKTHPARQIVVHQGEKVVQSTMLLEGLMCRYMDDRQGGRQLVAMHVPGDFVDLHGYPLQRLDHDVATLTESVVALVPHDALTRITEHHPHLARMMWFSTLLDAAMHREWIFRLGRLDAVGRVAHLFCEMNVRLSVVGLSDGTEFRFGVTQSDLAEACGITNVHVNRVLRVLRTDGVMEFKSGRAVIHDLAALESLAEFDDQYLYLDDGEKTP